MVAFSRDDPEYPAGLLDLEDPPATLFVRGAALPAVAHAVAVVGSRAASSYGRTMADRLASDLARMGYTVVSGLAHGIDAAAHSGAVAAGGSSVAVLASGLDHVTPRHHRELAGRIAARGGLITEQRSGAPQHRGAFVRRNRLIAALCGATVVVEAAMVSGALSTAAVARRLGRALLAVPGDIDRETSRGCHRLLREGAHLCEGAGDVARALESWARERGASRFPPPSAPLEARLLAALEHEPLAVEAIATALGVAVPDALGGLLALEWAGVARALPGQRWSRWEP